MSSMSVWELSLDPVHPFPWNGADVRVAGDGLAEIVNAMIYHEGVSRQVLAFGILVPGRTDMDPIFLLLLLGHVFVPAVVVGIQRAANEVETVQLVVYLKPHNVSVLFSRDRQGVVRQLLRLGLRDLNDTDTCDVLIISCYTWKRDPVIS